MTLTKKPVLGTLTAAAALFSLPTVGAAIIPLIPTGTTVTQTYFIDFSNDSSAQHLAELDNFFIPAAITSSADDSFNTNSQLPANVAGYNAMVVRYEKNGPDPDLIGAFNLNGVTSITDAILDLTVPTGYDHLKIFVYNLSGPNGSDPFVTPEGSLPDGGATATLLGLGALALCVARRTSK